MSRQISKNLIYFISKIFFFFLLLGCFVLDYFEINNLDNHLVYLSVFIAIICLLSILTTFIQKIRRVSYLIMAFFLITYFVIQNFVPSLKEAHLSISCLESKRGVWDYKEHRCRTDCWRWSFEKGCEK